jgi:hypothetical protein
MNNDLWNRCNVCGRIIALKDFLDGATHRLISPDASGCEETWETLCKEHAKDGAVERPKHGEEKRR